jgi:hypothetical protein
VNRAHEIASSQRVQCMCAKANKGSGRQSLGRAERGRRALQGDRKGPPMQGRHENQCCRFGRYIVSSRKFTNVFFGHRLKNNVVRGSIG